MSELTIPESFHELQHRAAPITDIDDKTGSIRFLAVPYESETELWPGTFEVFTRDAFKQTANNNPSRFKLFHQHGGPMVGVASQLDSKRDGLYVTGRFSAVDAAQDTRTLVREGILDAASIEFRAIPEKMTITRRGDSDDVLIRHDQAHGRGAALVPYPAYAGAEVISARAEAAAADHLAALTAGAKVRTAALAARLDRLRAVGA